MTADQPLKRIPISFLGKNGFPDPKGAPVIGVTFRYDPTHGKGLGKRDVSLFDLNAMIDTGADLNYADPSLIASAGCPQIGSPQVSGATSTIQSTHHLCHLFFGTIGMQIETDVVAAPLRANGRKFDLILGMLFVRTGSLVLNFVGSDFHFTFGPVKQ